MQAASHRDDSSAEVFETCAVSPFCRSRHISTSRRALHRTPWSAPPNGRRHAGLRHSPRVRRPGMLDPRRCPSPSPLERVGTSRSADEVVVGVPSIDRAIPEDARHLVAIGQPAPAPHRGDPEPAEPVDIWLLGGDHQCHRVLNDGIGHRAAKRHSQVLRHPRRVLEEVRARQRIHGLEVGRVAYRGRMDDPQAHHHPELLRQRENPRQDEIRVRAAEGPVRIDGQHVRYSTHALGLCAIRSR